MTASELAARVEAPTTGSKEWCDQFIAVLKAGFGLPESDKDRAALRALAAQQQDRQTEG